MGAQALKIDAFGLLQFSVEIGGAKKICWISKEALERHFGATEQTMGAKLLGNINRIAPVAQRVAARTPPGQRVVLKTGDF
jgi:hypothetical protein